MGGNFQGFDIVFLAIAAGFILYRLASVLGRRTGEERERTNPYARPPKGAARGKPDDAPAEAPAPRLPAGRSQDDKIQALAPAGSPLARALTELQIADRRFDPDAFLAGARTAYEMIVTAFAKGDRRALKPLLNEEVYRGFEEAVSARESRGEHVEATFVGIRAAEIVAARIKGQTAEVDVRFVAETISCTKNADGAVIEGDPTTIHETRDLWTFARNVKSSDPNWQLVATQTA